MPILDQHGRLRAAMNVGAQANRVTIEVMKRKFLDELQKAAGELATLLH